MAELRDRYKSHGFDENGNDFNVRMFEKITNTLTKTEQTLWKLSKAGVAGGVSAVGGATIGAVKGTVNAAKSIPLESLVSPFGPLGYLAGRTIKMLKGWGGTEYRSPLDGRKVSAKEYERDAQELKNQNKERQREEKERAIDTFQSFPTIKKLDSYIDAKLAADDRLESIYSAVVAFKEQEEIEREKQFLSEQEKKKEDTKRGKWLEKMSVATEFMATQQKLIVGGIVLAGVAILGLAAYMKTHTLKVRFPWQKDPEEEERDKQTKEAKEANKLTRAEKKAYAEQGISTDASKWMKLTGTSAEHVNKHGGYTDERYRQLGWGGIDIGGSVQGKAINAIYKGTVIIAAFGATNIQVIPDVGTKGFGNVVVTETNLTKEDKVFYRVTKSYLTGGLKIIYAHLDSIAVQKGSTVQKGTKIGIIGNTGASRGAHLHISVLHYNGSKWEPLMVDRIEWNYNGTTMATYDYIVALNSQAKENANKVSNTNNNANPAKVSTSDTNTYNNNVSQMANPLSTSGKNNATMLSNNVQYASGYNAPAKTTSSSPYDYYGSSGNAPAWLNTKTESKGNTLVFGATNSATRAKAQDNPQFEITRSTR